MISSRHFRDGRPAGEFEVKAKDWRPYPLTVELAEGEREIKIVFTNDRYVPPEDRNVAVERIEVSAEPAGD